MKRKLIKHLCTAIGAGWLAGHAIGIALILCVLAIGPAGANPLILLSGSPPAAGGGGDTTWATIDTLNTTAVDVTGERGMQITVGASPISITQLALWGHAGQYSTTITLYIKSSDGTSLGSVAVQTPAGTGTAGAFNWGTLSSPVALSASTTYYIMTAPLAYNTVIRSSLTTTAAATLNGRATDQPPTLEASENFCYGPLNFRYTTP
jgi:hypothetical protein